jgi:hypothetical protein
VNSRDGHRTRTCTHAHARTHMCTHTCARHMCTHTRTRTRTRAHAHARSHVRSHAHAHTHAHASARTRRTRTWTCANECAHACTRAHAQFRNKAQLKHTSQSLAVQHIVGGDSAGLIISFSFMQHISDLDGSVISRLCSKTIQSSPLLITIRYTR